MAFDNDDNPDSVQNEHSLNTKGE